MKKLALILTVVIFALSVAVPAYACGGDKSATKDCPKTCAGKATCDKSKCKDKKDCAAKCDGAKAESKTIGSSNDNLTVTPAIATSSTKTTVNLTGESGCPLSKNADTKAGGHSCTAAERAKCGADKKTGASEAKLPNGHPAETVAEAIKCDGSMVAFMSVDKMTCQGCVDHVTKTLGTMDGVCAIDVNLKKASATVVFHSDKVKTDDMIAAINKAGYVAKMRTDCSEDEMKAVFGDNYKEVCKKSCANTCKDKGTAKKSES